MRACKCSATRCHQCHLSLYQLRVKDIIYPYSSRKGAGKRRGGGAEESQSSGQLQRMRAGLVSSHCKQRGIIASLWNNLKNNGLGHDWYVKANMLSQFLQLWTRERAGTTVRLLGRP